MIESYEELEPPIPLLHDPQSFFPPPVSDWIEMVKKSDGYRQIVLVLEGNFGVSLFGKGV